MTQANLNAFSLDGNSLLASCADADHFGDAVAGSWYMHAAWVRSFSAPINESEMQVQVNIWTRLWVGAFSKLDLCVDLSLELWLRCGAEDSKRQIC